VRRLLKVQSTPARRARPCITGAPEAPTPAVVGYILVTGMKPDLGFDLFT